MKTSPAFCNCETQLCFKRPIPGLPRYFLIGKIRILKKVATRMNISRQSFVHIINKTTHAIIH